MLYKRGIDLPSPGALPWHHPAAKAGFDKEHIFRLPCISLQLKFKVAVKLRNKLVQLYQADILADTGSRARAKLVPVSIAHKGYKPGTNGARIAHTEKRCRSMDATSSLGASHRSGRKRWASSPKMVGSRCRTQALTPTTVFLCQLCCPLSLQWW